MNNKEKVIIYPFTREFAPILRNESLLEEFEIIALISPPGLGVKDEDAGFIDKGNNLGYKIRDSINSKLNDCETVVIADNNLYDEYVDDIKYKQIDRVIDKGKNIICTLELDENLRKKYKEKCQDIGVYFKYYSQESQKNEHVNREFLERIGVPVVFIAGLSEYSNKFYLQLSLRRRLLNDGYIVSQIGTRNYCEMLGFHSFPDYMLKNNISESNKVVLFNRYAKEIVDKESPDVLLIGIPGGIMPFNKEFNNKFGILAYEVSQALTPDFSIFSVLYDDFDESYYDKLFTSIKYKLGFEVDCFNISNNQFNWQESKINKKITLNNLNSNYIDKKIKEYRKLNYPLFNILNKDNEANLFEYMINTLSEYNQTEVLNL